MTTFHLECSQTVTVCRRMTGHISRQRAGQTVKSPRVDGLRRRLTNDIDVLMKLILCILELSQSIHGHGRPVAASDY